LPDDRLWYPGVQWHSLRVRGVVRFEGFIFFLGCGGPGQSPSLPAVTGQGLVLSVLIGGRAQSLGAASHLECLDLRLTQ
jgi:hypothetical protein